MTEHTDKSAQRAGRTPPRKRAGKSRPPDSKRARGSQEKAPQEKTAASHDGAAPRGDLAPDPATSPAPSPAPDPATVVFGSNRPIAAAPAKMPEGSGLRFAGPSAGLLKASGPQPSPPKASGLTFTSAKAAPATAATAAPKPGAVPPSKPAAAAMKPETATPETAKPEPGKADAGSGEARKPALTKPAIAPQASARHFEREERSTSGFVLMLLVLTMVGGGLAFWMKLSGEPAAPQAVAVPAAVATEPAAPLPAADDDFAAAAAQPAGEPAAALTAPDGALGSAEIGEIQRLLDRLDLDPGDERGVLTAATTAAIRSYQEMAGLPPDGEADRALLEELRSVVALYGS